MNWGKSIIAAFVFFAIFIFTLVYVCVKQEIPLVSKDYYEREINYQQQIQRLNNAELLVKKPTFHKVGSNLNVTFNQFDLVDDGELTLFRPSDLKFDTEFSFHKQQDSILQLDVRKLPAGMYRAKMQWTMAGKEYYVEEIVNL